MRKTLAASMLVAVIVAGLALLDPASRPADGAIRHAIHSQAGLLWRTADGQRLEADFYWPAEGCPCPAILELHGGGFTTGTRAWNTNVATALAHRGYFVMNTDYRLGGGVYPAMEDAEAAVGYLKARPEVDATRIGSHGTSAGGVLASGLAMRGADIGVVGAVSWSGGTETPVVTAASAPLLLAHSKDDPGRPFAESKAIYDAYVAKDRPARLYALEGEDHGTELHGNASVDLFTFRWLNRNVKGSVEGGSPG